jgi:hypothetical protein
MIRALVILYNLILVAGSAYLVDQRGWSMWVFLLAACFMMVTKTNKEKE